MPSTYTLNNGIELIATGEQSGTWGDTTNTNFQLLDTSLDGQVTVTLPSAGSSGSPNTLPVSDGAASNGRNRLVIFDDSSDLGATAYVQLTPNDAEKIIYVRNSLSGSRSILLFQGTYNASNDYEVPAGTTAVVFFNGAGSGAVAANVFNNAHFDALNLVGNAVVGGILSLADGSNSAPSLTNTGDTNTGLYFPAADEVGITTGGTQRLNVSATGIDVTGTVTMDGGSTSADFTFGDNDKAIFGGGSDLQIFHLSANNASYIQEQNATGSLYIEGADVYIRSYSEGDNMIVAERDGAVTLHYDNAAKLATTSTGVDITGGGVGVQITGANNSTGVNNALRFKDTDTGVVADQVIGRIEMETADTSNPGVNLQIDGIYGGSGAGSELVIKTGVAGSLENRLFIQDAATIVNDDSGDNDFVVRTSNSSATFYINGQYDGVGIHSSSPTSYANAQAVLYIEDNTNPALGISDTGQARDWWIVGFGDGLGIRYADGSNTGSASNTVPAMFFKNTGFVGVGDTGAPLSGLHLSDGTNAGSPQNAGRAATLMIDAGATASADIQLMVRNGYNQHIFFGDAADANIGMINYDHSTNHMNFTVNATQVLVIDEGGDVGIGTSNPVADLAIVDPTSQSGIEFQPEVATNTNRITNYDRTDNSYQKFRLDALEHSFYISGTERFRVEDTGNTLRIGNTTNAGFVDFDGSSLQLNTQRDPNTGSFVNTGRAHASIILSDGNGTGDSRIRFYTATTNNITGTSRLEVTHDGNVEITNGNLIMGTSGNGIDFSATSGTGTSELLDDYEEGNWTPSFSNTGGVTYDQQSGRYTKIGRAVHIQGVIRWSAFTPSSNVFLGGLPFTPEGSDNFINSVSIYPANGTAYNVAYEYLSGGQLFFYNNSGSLGGSATSNPFGSSGGIVINGIYYA